MLISRIIYGAGAGCRSAESCTHPTKRDRCFPPPIMDRQQLPNAGIEWKTSDLQGHLMTAVFNIVLLAE